MVLEMQNVLLFCYCSEYSAGVVEPPLHLLTSPRTSAGLQNVSSELTIRLFAFAVLNAKSVSESEVFNSSFQSQTNSLPIETVASAFTAF